MAKLVATADLLAAFVAFDKGRPWSPGGAVDCCLSLAEWAIWLGHPDPAAHLRGAYEPGSGQRDVLVAHGGALSLVRSCAVAIGGVEVAAPQLGCVGVVGSPINALRQFGVLHDGQGWLTRTPTGWTSIAARGLAAWEI